MIFNNLLLGTNKTGYIAGVGDGIVTVDGLPARRDTTLLDADSLAVLARSASLQSGHYMFVGLDADKKYIVMARDFAPDATSVQRYEPTTWDYVEPATDLTVTEQQALWQTWQT